MATGKRIRHAAWSPATTFELFMRRGGPPQIRLWIVGQKEDGSRSPESTPGRLKLLKPPDAVSAELHQLRGLLSE